MKTVNVKTVVKYDVYLDILLAGSIYVTTYDLFNEHPKSLSSPRHPGLGTAMTFTSIENSFTAEVPMGIGNSPKGQHALCLVAKVARSISHTGSSSSAPMACGTVCTCLQLGKLLCYECLYGGMEFHY